MSLLAWNCQGVGGSLDSPKMRHLARLIMSGRSSLLSCLKTRLCMTANPLFIHLLGLTVLLLTALFAPVIGADFVYLFQPLFPPL